MRLYETNEQHFNSLGICSLNEYISCTVTEELNGMYELEMTYPMDSRAFKELKIGRIIYCRPNPYSVEQPFRIYEISTPLNRIVTVSASHISYDLSGYVVDPFVADSALLALRTLKDNSTHEIPFNFITDITSNEQLVVETPESVRSIIGNHMIDTYKCCVEYDCFDVYLKSSRGNDNGVSIMYGKNLTDIKQEENNSLVYTAVYPYWIGRVTNENDEYVDEMVVLSERVVSVPGNHTHTNVGVVDLSSVFEEKPSEEELRRATELYIEEVKLGIPTISITVDFVQLSNSEEYSQYRLLDKVMLGDTVTVIFEEANISAKAVCIKTTYDLALNKYTTIELGDAVKTLYDIINDDDRPKDNINDTLNDLFNKLKDLNKDSEDAVKEYVENAIRDLTDSITGNDGGYVRFNPPENPSEILIMDNEDLTQAVVVWRWNKEGLGVSRTGYNGPFVGIGQNGRLVVNEATAYKITALMIEGGVLSSVGGSLTMSLEDDYFQFSHTDGTTKTRIDQNGFYILDGNNETIASLASIDSWSHLVADTVYAANIRNVYLGDANLYVDHGSTAIGNGTQSNPFTTFEELKNHLESDPIINKNVVVNVVSSGAFNDYLLLEGLTGPGTLRIILNKELVLNFTEVNAALHFRHCDKAIYIEGGRTAYNSADGALINKFRYGVFFERCKFGSVQNMAIDTSGSTGGDQYGIIFRSTNGQTRRIDFVNSPNGMLIDEGSNVWDNDSCGNCSLAWLSNSGSTMMYGTDSSGNWRPNGKLAEGSGKIFAIDDGATAHASVRVPPPTPATSDHTSTFYATGFGTYQYAWGNWAYGEWGNRAIQGIWETYGNKSGHIFFNMSNIRNFIGSGTVKSATITLTRRNGGGYSAATNIYINGSSCSSASGTPTYYNNALLGTLSWGEKKTFNISTTIINNLKNGTCNSLACYSSSNGAYAEIVAASLTIKVNK